MDITSTLTCSSNNSYLVKVWYYGGLTLSSDVCELRRCKAHGQYLGFARVSFTVRRAQHDSPGAGIPARSEIHPSSSSSPTLIQQILWQAEKDPTSSSPGG